MRPQSPNRAPAAVVGLPGGRPIVLLQATKLHPETRKIVFFIQSNRMATRPPGRAGVARPSSALAVARAASPTTSGLLSL